MLTQAPLFVEEVGPGVQPMVCCGTLVHQTIVPVWLVSHAKAMGHGVRCEMGKRLVTTWDCTSWS